MIHHHHSDWKAPVQESTKSKVTLFLRAASMKRVAWSTTCRIGPDLQVAEQPPSRGDSSDLKDANTLPAAGTGFRAI
jgi:hypothetical protein